MKIKLLSLFFLNSWFLYGQTKEALSIQFIPSYEEEVLLLDEAPFEKADLQIEALKVYISQLSLLKKGTTVFSEANSYHLLDAENPVSLKLALSIPTDLAFDQLSFKIGIDSLTNCSGVYGGDLDPTQGMYWTWQSGYINFKLEGTATNCPARKNQFQFHLGGYQYPYNSLQEVVLDLETSKEIVIPIKIDEFLQDIDLKETYEVMSPSSTAVKLAESLTHIFTVSK